MFQVEQLNQQALEICRDVQANAQRLNVNTVTTEQGATILDFGTNRLGTLAAGIELSRICLSGMADVSIIPGLQRDLPLPMLQVTTDFPMEACMASQYAGWPFSTEKYFSMCSGPARLKRGREEVLKQYELTTTQPAAVGIFESKELPDESDLQEFADECSCKISDVTVCVARTSSLPGSMQVVSRSIETAMHKLFELDFDLTKVQRAIGFAPIPPTGTDDYVSMGWTNDSILFGAEVVLWIDYFETLDLVMDKLPSRSSKAFGRPFIEVFEEYDRDFYKVDKMLFSPAKVTAICTATGRIATAGRLRPDLLSKSFGILSFEDEPDDRMERGI